MIAQLQDIIPALTGFFFGLIVLVYFVFKKNSLGMVISSISCILLMFIFQIISVNIDKLNSFLETYQDILKFPLTVLVTAASIFLGNTLIRYFTDRKEKREFAILFINAIESHINILEIVFSQINLGCLGEDLIIDDREYIEVYKSSLIENKGYDIAFNKIGIFNENEINLVSRYDKNLKESVFHINIFCCTMSGDTETYHEKIKEISFKLKFLTNTEKHYLIMSFNGVKIIIPITIILGYLCIYQLSLNYLRRNLAKDRGNFLENFDSKWEALWRVFWSQFTSYKSNNITFHVLKRRLSDNLIDELKYIRESYRKIDKAKNTKNREPIYLFRILINNYIDLTGTPKNGDKHTRIKILSNQEDFIGLTSEIPTITLIDHAKPFLKRYIKESCKTEKILEEDIDKFIENCKYESYIISPWGEEIEQAL
ncbi:MAG: hypothetical protein F6K40_06210 [Okeania sp. SIO3I5]|uniref:hypothetical protein n=1 Tax=Okeania sp. SIO3I5 TaxID=2607805 RepID=UPI0013B659E4|nr:hypothetical protein [Okeania sp. SIO3I5]NEQ35902.1 hypothetical protein [Okeania sp. SIO3I5]